MGFRQWNKGDIRLESQNPLFGGQNGGQITKEQILTSVRESEFVNMVSRGKFDYPSEELFDLSLYLYSYYKSKEDKCCQ